MKQIIEAIKEYNKIIIIRHQRPDGDCMGSSIGLREMLRQSFPEKEVYSVGKTKYEYLNFIGEEDVLEEKDYNNALIIAVDTSTKERIDDDYYHLGDKLIKIDHHIVTDDYGDIKYVLDEQPATCCIITKMWQEYKDVLKMNDKAAFALYAGIVTDTGRFRFRSVNSECLYLASKLLDYNIDLEWLYSKLYLKDPKLLSFQGEVLRKLKTTENVAYVYVTKAIQEKYDLLPEESSNVVSVMDSLPGILAWVGFIDQNDGTIRVRIRSRFCPVVTIGEKYSGGGHANACGATLYKKTEIKKLIKDLDQLVGDYKRSNDGWL